MVWQPNSKLRPLGLCGKVGTVRAQGAFLHGYTRGCIVQYADRMAADSSTAQRGAQ